MVFSEKVFTFQSGVTTRSPFQEERCLPPPGSSKSALPKNCSERVPSAASPWPDRLKVPTRCVPL